MTSEEHFGATIALLVTDHLSHSSVGPANTCHVQRWTEQSVARCYCLGGEAANIRHLPTERPIDLTHRAWHARMAGFIRSKDIQTDRKSV